MNSFTGSGDAMDLEAACAYIGMGKNYAEARDMLIKIGAERWIGSRPVYLKSIIDAPFEIPGDYSFQKTEEEPIYETDTFR